jgi:adenylate cyclase
VISRGTAFTYKGKPLDAKQIGRELGVRYLLEGSVRRIGEKVEVNAQLISTETGAHVWADRFDGERGKLGQLQVDFVARLANSLGVELVKAEALRAMRERPNNPDAVDLAMQGWVERYRGVASKTNEDAAIGLFERALAIDPYLVPAMSGLAETLVDRVTWLHSDDPKGDIARAEDLAERAVSAEPDSSDARMAKARVLYAKRQWPQAVAEADAAIAANPNNANAQARRSFWKLYLGRAEDGFSGLETAFRLSPRDPFVPIWQFEVCVLHIFLARWEQGIEWCEKARAGSPATVYGLVNLAAANAWAGHDQEAKEAVAQLQKLSPGFTVQKYTGIHFSDDPTFNAQRARIVEGLRKAGLPESEASLKAACGSGCDARRLSTGRSIRAWRTLCGRQMTRNAGWTQRLRQGPSGQARTSGQTKPAATTGSVGWVGREIPGSGDYLQIGTPAPIQPTIRPLSKPQPTPTQKPDKRKEHDHAPPLYRRFRPPLSSFGFLK